MERVFKLVREDRSQTVCIPEEFELPGDTAILRKDGGRLILEPLPPRKSLLELLTGWRPLDETLAEIPDLPAESVEI